MIQAHEWIEEQILKGAEAADAADDPFIECQTVRLSDVKPEQVEWLWRERIAIGKLTLIVGDPGQGKSFLTLDIGARVSRAAAWPDNPWEPQPAGDVILLTAEDDLGDTIRPRLDALEADVSRIIAIRGAKFVDDDNERMVNLSTDLQSIRKVVSEANEPRLLIIDPVSAYLGKTDSHNNAEVRGVLAPLAELASELRIAVVAVSHLRKGEGRCHVSHDGEFGIHCRGPFGVGCGSRSGGPAATVAAANQKQHCPGRRRVGVHHRTARPERSASCVLGA